MGEIEPFRERGFVWQGRCAILALQEAGSASETLLVGTTGEVLVYRPTKTSALSEP
tara:strand:- start:429 stop:596 length:168 start_codon:yes stop_codon:yes gene_type:complete